MRSSDCSLRSSRTTRRDHSIAAEAYVTAGAAPPVPTGKQAKIDHENCTIYLGISVICGIAA